MTVYRSTHAHGPIPGALDVLAVLAWTGNKIMPAPLHLRVFISSPGDVGDERNLVRRLLKDELPYDAFLRGKVTLDPVSWDDPAAPIPLPANLTLQEAVNRFGRRPSECDIVIVLLWSRLGTHLDLSKFSKPNGEPYLSGTEYEYEEAVSAKKPPDILVYRRTERVQIYADDPQFDDKRAQYTRAQAFFDRFKNRNGSFRGGFTEYATPTDFGRRQGSAPKPRTLGKPSYISDGWPDLVPCISIEDVACVRYSISVHTKKQAQKPAEKLGSGEAKSEGFSAEPDRGYHGNRQARVIRLVCEDLGRVLADAPNRRSRQIGQEGP